VAGQWFFSPGTLVSSTNETDSHDIVELLLKVVLNTITLTIINLSKSLNNSLINCYIVTKTLQHYKVTAFSPPMNYIVYFLITVINGSFMCNDTSELTILI